MSTYSDAVLADSPAVYYRLGEPSGTVAEDATANNRDGTYIATPTLGVPGAIGGDPDTAVQFAAASSQEVHSASYIFNAATATVEVWVKIAAAPASPQFIAGCGETPGSSIADKFLYVGSDGKLYFYLYDGGPKTTSAPASAIPTGQWVHVVGTADSSTARAYQNGVEVGTVAAGAAFTGYTLPNVTAGMAVTAGVSPGYLDGAVDEFAVYPSPLSAARVAAHYAAAPPPPSLWAPQAAPVRFS